MTSIINIWPLDFFAALETYLCEIFKCYKSSRKGAPIVSSLGTEVTMCEWRRACYTPVNFCRFPKYLVLKPSLWLKVVNGKRRQVLVLVLIATFALQKRKIAFFTKPDKLLIDGRFVPLWTNLGFLDPVDFNWLVYTFHQLRLVFFFFL